MEIIGINAKEERKQIEKEIGKEMGEVEDDEKKSASIKNKVEPIIFNEKQAEVFENSIKQLKKIEETTREAIKLPMEQLKKLGVRYNVQL